MTETDVIPSGQALEGGPSESIGFLGSILGKNVIDEAFKPKPGTIPVAQKPIQTPPQTNVPQGTFDEGGDEDEDGEVDPATLTDQNDDNVLLKAHLQRQNMSAIPGNFNNLQELGSYVQKRYSIEDFPTFINSVDTWRKDSRELPQLRRTVDNFKSGMAMLPEDLAAAVRVVLQTGGKGDYRSEFNKYQPDFDYSRSFKDHDIMDLAKKWMPKTNFVDPNKPNHIDLTDKTDPAAQELVNVLKDKYEAAQKDWQSKSKAPSNPTQSNFEESFEKAVVASVKELATRYPITKRQMTAVQEVIRSGAADDLIFDSANNLRKDAAMRIWHGMYGEKQAEGLLAKIAELEDQMAQLLSRGGTHIPVGPSSPKRGAGGVRQQAEAKNYLQSATKGGKHPLASL